jgi:hypothetical protein
MGSRKKSFYALEPNAYIEGSNVGGLGFAVRIYSRFSFAVRIYSRFLGFNDFLIRKWIDAGDFLAD